MGRRFKDFLWSTRHSWSRQSRVVAKAEWTQSAANPHFKPAPAKAGVTSLDRSEHEARHLDEKIYCARGQADICQA